ncbi:hypothetical protein LP416_16550 [Polaromonas sp. P2-4]|nr:hypothetical protein LP416_16550 [Polaromonas sp. P2-4]
MLATDVGPVIDREAFDNIQNHLQRLSSTSKVLSAHKGRAQEAPDLIANSIAPAAFEVSSLAALPVPLLAEQTVTVNTTAAGGNAALLAG